MNYPTIGYFDGHQNYPTDGFFIGHKNYPTSRFFVGHQNNPTGGFFIGHQNYLLVDCLWHPKFPAHLISHRFLKSTQTHFREYNQQNINRVYIIQFQLLTTAQSGRVAGFIRLELSLESTRCFRWRFDCADFAVVILLSRRCRNARTLSARQSIGFTVITSSFSMSLSSLLIISGTSTFPHFSFSFCDMEDLVRVDRRSCSFYKKRKM